VSGDEPAEVAATFTRIDSRELEPIAVVAQCLDNQWVPQDLLRRMLRRGEALGDRAVARRRAVDARAEYLRALLNSQQVVINRAFFFNNPVIYRDFVDAGQSRDAFLRLLGDRVLVPFLFTEDSPGQRPDFTSDAVGWPAWRGVLGDTHLACLRLSWDADENDRSVRRLMTQRFRRFLGSLGFLDTDGLRTDLDLPDEAVGPLAGVLREATTWAMDQPNPTREDFYRRFVVADGTDPAVGRYDPAKPFAGELKQLVDLRYNTSLPDALDRYPLTPADSLHRTALQEERWAPRAGDPADPAELAATLLRRRTFDLVQRPLRVSLTGLDLPQIWQARHTDEWHAYVDRLQALLRHPEEFDVRAQQVYDAYVGLAGRLAELVGDRRTDLDAEWRPVIKVVIEVLGATLSIVYSGDPVVEVSGRVAEEVAARASTAVVRFIVTHRDRRLARNQLATGIDIMRVRFARTGADWAELIDRLRAGGLAIREGGDEDDPAMDSRDDPDE
jgi:hypothetical protein